MSEVMMGVLQRLNESLTRQVEKLGPENEQVRKLLTEFDKRHDKDRAEIDRLRGALSMLSIATSTGEGLSPAEVVQMNAAINATLDAD